MGQRGLGLGERAGFNNTDRSFFDDVLFAYDQSSAVRGTCRRARRASIASRSTSSTSRTWMRSAEPLAELIGKRAADKFVPEVVWRGGWGVKRAFLMACFEGDGGPRVAPDGFTIHYSTYSERLGVNCRSCSPSSA